MKLKLLALPLVAALVITTTACSPGSESSSAPAKTASTRIKNAAITPPKKRLLKQDANTGVLAKPSAADTPKRTPSNTSVGVAIQSTGNPVLVPSDFCSIIQVNCKSLDFAQVEVTGTSSFIATAVIPNASIQLPAGDGFAFDVLKTSVQVVAQGAESKFAIIADTKLTISGSSMPLTLTGTYVPAEATIAVELTNDHVGLKDAMGIPGFDISSITGKTTFVGGVPKGIGFSVTGTVPTILKELGINPQTQFTAAFEVGVGVTLGMSFGSQADGAPNIFNLKNVLSARYLAFSYSSLGTTIAGVEYPKGFAMSFDGKFVDTAVVVDGNVSFAPLEYNIEFTIGAFSIGGFKFDESYGQMQRDDSGLNLAFSGGLQGYGMAARLKGTFDPVGGIELIGEGAFKPAGLELGNLKFNLVANSKGVNFIGTGTNKFGVVTGATTVGFKSFPNNQIGFTLGVTAGLQIPGMPSYGSVEGSLSVTNCPDMKCTSPMSVPTATLSGTSQFYGSPKQSFSVDVDPNNWGFRKELSFHYDEKFEYSSNGFSVGARASGNGSVVISDKGISFGKGSISASAGFDTPDVRVPEVTIPPTKTRLYKTVCKPWYKCHQEGYWSYAGGETITKAYTIPGIHVNLGASVGIDNKGFYVDISGNDKAKGNRLYFS